ncbi:MAG: ABC transporter permease [Gammaproteobacteria bacterium]|nr:ABC transporter permease [Gammaproteobacteria bacterium]NIR96980.1 ABC transporter permease [Gammaproteobacteria bacterium]NIT62682.1 ABC transporter permease [Gammaproteobacteria bacterium]NIV19642.1 ABC transporter permease subunit [Gammaproteobacteria bacterium]NIX10862.1 ABC transporter permease subunit [Gammaproteobacteria bacterium]
MVIRAHKTWWLTPAVLVGLGAVLLLWLPAAAGVKPVYLWTDRLVYLLVAMAVVLVGYIRHREHLSTPWRQVFRRRIAMGAAVILGVYVIVGLLDSVHFRTPLPRQAESSEVHYSVRVTSVLDALAEPLRRRVEKTYSAPFATHLYSKEAVDQADGSTIRVYPRLQYGGAHLEDPARDRGADIAWHLVLALVRGLGIWLLLVGMGAMATAYRTGLGFGPAARRLLRGRTELPWHVALYAALAIIIFTMAVIQLGTKYHILGTDKVGQDVFYQAVKSIRTGLVIGTLATLVMLPFAIMLGIAAGYFKRWADDVIQYVYTTLNSIPGVLLIAAAILSIQIYIENHPELFETGTDRADLQLLALCIILGVTSWTGLCRLLRGETFKIAEMDYIEAATAFGVHHFKIIGRHILPNVMHIVLIIIVLDFSGLVLAEAVLSYIGVGVDPSTTSWGNMINSARLEMAREPVVWWSLFAAFLFMFTLVLSANLFSDAVRDAFDPRLRAMT